jgi:hypothetical protein
MDSLSISSFQFWLAVAVTLSPLIALIVGFVVTDRWLRSVLGISAPPAPRCCRYTVSRCDPRRNRDPVRAGTAAPRRARDQNGDRRA